MFKQQQIKQFFRLQLLSAAACSFFLVLTVLLHQSSSTLAVMGLIFSVVTLALSILILMGGKRRTSSHQHPKKIAPQFDRTTKAFSRKYGELYLAQCKDRVHSCDTDTVIMMLEINDYRRLEPEFGQDILKIVSSTIVSKMREYDRLIRWSESCFVLCFEEVKSSQHEMLAKKVLESVENLEFQSSGEHFNLSVSIGGANMRDAGNEPQAVVECAQMAMDRSKQRLSKHYTWYDELKSLV